MSDFKSAWERVVSAGRPVGETPSREELMEVLLK